jgi:hypothetical protein
MGYKKTEAIKIMLKEYDKDEARITDDYVNTIHERFIQLMVQYYSTINELQPLPHTEEVFTYCRDNGIKKRKPDYNQASRFNDSSFSNL